MIKAKRNLEESIRNITVIADHLYYDHSRLKYGGISRDGYNAAFTHMLKALDCLRGQIVEITRKEEHDKKVKRKRQEENGEEE